MRFMCGLRGNYVGITDGLRFGFSILGFFNFRFSGCILPCLQLPCYFVPCLTSGTPLYYAPAKVPLPSACLSSPQGNLLRENGPELFYLRNLSNPWRVPRFMNPVSLTTRLLANPCAASFNLIPVHKIAGYVVTRAGTLVKKGPVRLRNTSPAQDENLIDLLNRFEGHLAAF